MDLGSRNKIQVEGGMSSMTDLVFLLLIFFIIMSTLASTQYNVDLPNGADVPEPLQDGTIDVVIMADNTVRIESDQGEGLSIPQAEKQIVGLRDQLLAAGMKEPKLKIHADKSSEFEKFNDIMVIAKRYDLKLVINTQ